MARETTFDDCTNSKTSFEKNYYFKKICLYAKDPFISRQEGHHISQKWRAAMSIITPALILMIVIIRAWS